MSQLKKVSYPAILDLPHSVVAEVVLSLDNSALHNWRRLVEHLDDYSQQDILRLKNIRLSGGSPTKELLTELHSLGWNIVDLCTLARKAQVQVVVDILVRYSNDTGLDSSPLCAQPSRSSWTGAKNCHKRSGYPATIAPPLHARSEAVRRYNLKTSDQSKASEDTAAKCSPPSSVATPPSGPPDTTPTKPVATPPDVLPGLPHVSYKVLLETTGGLDETPYSSGGHKLGEGGFGEVFYCQLVIREEKVEAAVKVLRKREEEGSTFGSVNREQFSTEISSLSRLSHPHLLSLLAYSQDGAHLCLIYPYLPRGSLDKYVTDISALPPHTRVGVAVGVASALDYLHTGVEGEQIVHRDVKSANILLASDWTAKLGDFGVARIIPSEVTSLMTTTIVGTTIFMAPEYRTGTVTPAADVYALGVVLFELLTGQSALDRVTMETGEETDLVTYILELEEEPGDVLVGSWREGVWQGVWSVAEQCLEHYDFKRPTSKDVYGRLNKLHSQI